MHKTSPQQHKTNTEVVNHDIALSRFMRRVSIRIIAFMHIQI